MTTQPKANLSDDYIKITWSDGSRTNYNTDYEGGYIFGRTLATKGLQPSYIPMASMSKPKDYGYTSEDLERFEEGLIRGYAQNMIDNNN